MKKTFLLSALGTIAFSGIISASVPFTVPGKTSENAGPSPIPSPTLIPDASRVVFLSEDVCMFLSPAGRDYSVQGHRIRDDGATMPQRIYLNFISTPTVEAILSDDTPGSETEITFSIPTEAIGPTELASSPVTPGTYANPTITVDADGRLTAASNGSSGGGGSAHEIRDDGAGMTQRGALNFLSSSTVNAALTDDSGSDETEVTLTIPASAIGSTQLASTAVTPGSYTAANITIDADGRITAASNGVGGATGHLIRDDGFGMTQRGALNFLSSSTVNAALTDDSGTNETEVTLTIPASAIGSTQLASTAVTPGNYTLASVSVDADGRLTAASNGTADPSAADDITVSTNAGGDVTGTFDDLQIVPGAVSGAELASTGVSPGSYTAANITVDADGRITVASNGSGGATGHALRDEGVNMTQRGAINFVSTPTIDATLADDAGSNETEVALSIPPDAVGPVQLASTAVTPGAYTLANITVDADGRITAVSNGSGGGGGGSIPSVITAAQITAPQNNYAPAGWADATIVRLSGDNGFRAINGFAAETSGEVKTLVNVGAYSLYLAPEHVGSAAANRIRYKEEVIIPPGESVQIYYDGVLSRWVPIDPPAPGYQTTGKGVYYDQMPTRIPTAVSENFPFFIWGSITLLNGGPTANEPFVFWDMNTGSTPSGGSGMAYVREKEEMAFIGTAHMVAKTYCKTPANLSDASNSYYWFLRLADFPSSGFWNQNNSLGIRYWHQVNGGRFECYARNGSGTDTTVDSGITFEVNKEYEMAVSLNKSNTEATFFINGAVVGRISSGLPGGVAVGPSQQLEKTAGSSARSWKVYRFIGAAIAP